MRKIIFYLLLLISSVSFGQTTLANKLKITAAIKDNLASRVMVQDSLTGELKWILKSSLGTVKSVTGTSGVTVALGTTTPVIGLGAITPTSTNGVSATTMAYNDATSSIQTQLNGKQPVGTYATGTGTASGTNTGDNAVNTLYSGLVTNATHTGEVTGATALTITNKAVTLAKMDDVATGTVFYRKTAATGTPEVQTLATLKTDLGLTGTNSGDQTTISGNAGTATTLQTGRTIAITGDLAYTSPTFNGSANVTAAGTLATVNANVGSFTNASVTVNGKGLVTAASSGPTPQAALSGTGLVRSTAGAITYDTNAYITTVNGTAITPSSTNGVSAATMAFNDATSSIQTQLNGKQPSGTYATGTGTASGTNTGDNAVNSLYSGLVTNATHTGDATGATALTVKGINGTLLSGLATGILKNTTTTGVPSIAVVRTDYAEPTTALATGILKNTTTTGAHTIAVAADFPTLNQNTTGNAATVTTNANLTGVVTSVGNATAIADGAIALAKLAPTTAGFIPVGAVTTGIPTYVPMSGDVTISSTGVTAIGATKVTNAMLANTAVANLSGTNTGNQTIASTSDATSHTATLSATGGSLKLVEGSNITLTTSGTGADGIVTIASTAGGTGTVTASGGALTANAIVLGAGTTDTKVSTGITTDGVAALNLGVNATTIGKVKLFGNTSGDATIQPSAVAGTATVLTLPATSGTVALLSNITGTNSGTNTGDNAVNTLYSGLVSNVPTALSTGTVSTISYGITSDGSSDDIVLPQANTTQAGLLSAAKWNEIVANTAKVSNANHTGDATGSTALSVVGINGTLLSSLGTGILKNTTTTGVPSIAVAADFPTLNQNTTGTASNITGVYGGTITSSQVTTGLGFTPENAANKQNSLTVDGSGVKYSTVDAVNAGLATKQNTIINPVTGTGAGTTNTIPKFTGTSALGDSGISDNGSTTTLTYASTASIDNRINIINAGNGGAGRGTSITIGVPGSSNSVDGVKLNAFTTGGAVSLQSTDFAIQTSLSGTLSERMRIISNGNVLIGTTTDSGNKLRVNGTVRLDNLASGTTTQMVTSDLNGVLGYQALPSGGGATNLSYTASPTNGVVASDTGTDATIPLADGTNAGLLAPVDYNVLSNLEANTTNVTVWNNGKGNINTNTSYGDGTLIANTTGGSNTAIGYNVLVSNLTGNFNTAVGTSTLTNNTSSNNTALGALALTSNTTGANNTAVGNLALTNSSGSNSIAIGNASGRYITDGTTAATVIDSSILIGNNVKVLANSQTNQTVIGDGATGNGSNTTTIGNASTTDTYLKGAVRGGSFISTQVTPTAKTATATLTIAEILTDITTVTSTTAVTLTLPTGTLTDAGVQSGTLAVNDSFEWTIINLGTSSGAVTMAAGTGHTYVGATAVAIGTSATFRTRKTAANTFVTYRI